MTPEQQARQRIDAALEEAGWVVQDWQARNPSASLGVAVREFRMSPGHGRADYLLFVEGVAVGALEAKSEGTTLRGVELQAEMYSAGVPADVPAPVKPLPFLYLSTGWETLFFNLLDPKPRSRPVSLNLPHIHRPRTLADWIHAPSLPAPEHSAESTNRTGPSTPAPPSSLRSRLQAMPPFEQRGLYDIQYEGIQELEKSLRANRQRSLIQMATGSGKTLMAVAAMYRLIRHANARRILFLVDRKNLGVQAENEFDGYITPAGWFFTSEYNVERLTTNSISDSSKVVIATIQRIYSMLRGEPFLDPALEDESHFQSPEVGLSREVVYNPSYPPDYFDFIFIDEAHRSIFTVWRQVVEYFDAFLIGLTATPSAQSLGFFDKLILEYPHERAVADGVNVDFEVYEIGTRITGEGGLVAADTGSMLGYRNKRTRVTRWEKLDEDFVYGPKDLDHRVVAKKQIRMVLETLKDRWREDLFPHRRELPKTVIFAKNDNHAEDIVTAAREIFQEGNEFCRKITYRSSGVEPEELIRQFRTSYHPRIAVAVDMISTGTDIRPLEILVFMRPVQSALLFEQMKGRGVRTISPTDLRRVTDQDVAKTHFVLIDAVGLDINGMSDTQPLERSPSVPFGTLIRYVAGASRPDPDKLSSLASRLSRLAKRCSPGDQDRVCEVSGGLTLADLTRGLIEALDPDYRDARAREHFSVPEDEAPSPEQLEEIGEVLLREAVEPFRSNPALCELLENLKSRAEQIIDEITQDELIRAEFSPEARAKQLRLVRDFRTFLEENREEIEALKFFYGVPYSKRLSYADVKELADAIRSPPRSWTPEGLWRAYESLDGSKVRGASGRRLLTDLVSLVRYALERDEELVPYGETVRERFDAWMERQETRGRFTDEQRRWLEMMRDHVATSMEMTVEDLDYAPFGEEGGLARAARVFGDGGRLREVLEELNEVLAA